VTKVLDRVNIADVSRYGYLRRWYGFSHDGFVLWTPTPEVSRKADFQVVVHTQVMDDVLSRAVLMDRYSNVAVCDDWAVQP